MTSALEQHFAMPQTFAGVTIEEVPARKMWQLEGFANIETSVASMTQMAVPAANEVSMADGQLLAWQGRDRYVWVTDQSAVSGDDVYATDQSQSKTQLRIKGEDAKALLARGLQLDLDDNVFAVGSLAMSHINHVGITVMRLPDEAGQPVFEIWVMRGFAVSLMEFLTASAATLR